MHAVLTLAVLLSCTLLGSVFATGAAQNSQETLRNGVRTAYRSWPVEITPGPLPDPSFPTISPPRGSQRRLPTQPRGCSGHSCVRSRHGCHGRLCRRSGSGNGNGSRSFGQKKKPVSRRDSRRAHGHVKKRVVARRNRGRVHGIKKRVDTRRNRGHGRRGRVIGRKGRGHGHGTRRVRKGFQPSRRGRDGRSGSKW